MPPVVVKKMERVHKRFVVKIGYESMATLTERFYFRVMLLFNGVFNFSVALCEDSVVGFISTVDSLRDGLVVGNIAVASDYRRRGVASLLLESVLLVYPARQVTLQVRESNVAAQALYAKFGFEKTGVIEQYYPNKGTRKKESAVVMVLPIFFPCDR